MPSTRIFVGGLSNKVDRQELGGKLSCYAPVLSIDVKEKTDLEGNVLQRFAYVNVDATSSQVEQCIQQLNGASWKGSHLRVERAKESFLERLKRERADRKQEGKNALCVKSDNLEINNHFQSDNLVINNHNQKVHAADIEDGLAQSKEHKVCPEQSSVLSDAKHSKKRKEHNNSEENCLSSKKSKNVQVSDEISQSDARSYSTKKGKKENNEIEEKILSSFKQFSSVWADSDGESDEGSGCGVICEELQDGKTEVEFEKLAHHESHGGTRNPQERAPLRVHQHEDTDATLDEDYDNSAGSYTDVREQQQTQLDIFDNLDAPHKCAPKTERGKDAVSDQVTKNSHTLSEDRQHKIQASVEKPETHETMQSDGGANIKYVKVSKDLSFGQNTSGFSLLAQFSRINKEASTEVEREEEMASPVSAPRPLVTVHQKVKKRSFFISADDREIDAAIKWMTQPISEEVIKEFEEALPDLRQVIRTRSFRAKKEDVDARMQRRGRGRGRGRGQGRGRTSRDDTGNPYRDHRWRERDIKK